MTEEGEHDRLVDRYPQRDPVGQPLTDDGGVLAEALRGLAGHPPALRLEGRREVPVVERDEGSDPRLEQGVDGTVVEVQAGRVDRTGAGRLDAWPRDGEAVGIDPEATEQL